MPSESWFMWVIGGVSVGFFGMLGILYSHVNGRLLGLETEAKDGDDALWARITQGEREDRTRWELLARDLREMEGRLLSAIRGHSNGD